MQNQWRAHDLANGGGGGGIWKVGGFPNLIFKWSVDTPSNHPDTYRTPLQTTNPLIAQPLSISVIYERGLIVPYIDHGIPILPKIW